jgi:sugar transferase (PEP-CTERM/EpsH1 system associated)
MIKHLGVKHSVVVATLAHTEAELQEGARLREYCDEVIAEVESNPVRWCHAVLALPTSQPSSGKYFWSRHLQQRIRQAFDAAPFDRILVHCAFMAQYVAELPCPFKVLDYGDIDSAKWREYQEYRSFPLSLGYALEARKLRRYEKKMARCFPQCTVTTRAELSEFETMGTSVPCRVIPNGVDTEYFKGTPWLRRNARVIAFVGRMDYFPNVDGILYFAKEIFPLVREKVPDAELRIIGSEPGRAILNLNQMPGVKVTGYVPDVRPHLLDAAVAVAPLRIARGTQNKILEMMAFGVPVVATSQAARGIQGVPGEHLLVADQVRDFAKLVVEFLQDQTLRAKFAVAARAQVEKVHSWPASMSILDDVLQLSVDRPTPSSTENFDFKFVQDLAS